MSKTIIPGAVDALGSLDDRVTVQRYAPALTRIADHKINKTDELFPWYYKGGNARLLPDL